MDQALIRSRSRSIPAFFSAAAAPWVTACLVGLLCAASQAKAAPQDQGGATIESDGGGALPTVDPIHFEFGKQDLTPEGRKALDDLAKILIENPELKVTIEGHADERGSSEFNIALGEQRADAARKYLIRLGVKESQLRTVSYGEERPAVPESNEEAWAKNRRDEMRFGGRLTPPPDDEAGRNAQDAKDSGEGDEQDKAGEQDKGGDDDADKGAGDDDKAGQGEGPLGMSYLFWGGTALVTVGAVGIVAGAAGAGTGAYFYTDATQPANIQQYGLYALIGFGALGVASAVGAAVGGGLIAYDQLSE